MDDCYVGDDDYVRMLVLLATSMVMMVPVIVTIGNGNEAYCSCEENADRDTMVVALMVRKTMVAVLMVINSDDNDGCTYVRSHYVRTCV